MAKEPAPDSVKAAGNRLRLMRMALKKDQAKICRDLKIKPNTWNNAERGRNRLSFANLLKIRRAYSVGRDWINHEDLRVIPEDILKRVREIEAEEATQSKRA